MPTATHRPKTTQLAEAAAQESPTGRDCQAELFERVIARIHRYFARLLRDPHEAEECTQETLLELQRSLREAKYEAGRSWNTWMFLKAHTVYVSWCRRHALKSREQEVLPRPGTDFQEQADRRLDAQTLLAELAARLGSEAHECFVLRYEGGLTLDQVAAATDCTRRTVSRRLERAHATIDELLGRRP